MGWTMWGEVLKTGEKGIKSLSWDMVSEYAGFLCQFD